MIKKSEHKEWPSGTIGMPELLRSIEDVRKATRKKQNNERPIGHMCQSELSTKPSHFTKPEGRKASQVEKTFSEVTRCQAAIIPITKKLCTHHEMDQSSDLGRCFRQQSQCQMQRLAAKAVSCRESKNPRSCSSMCPAAQLSFL
jgi:hypothetical protein